MTLDEAIKHCEEKEKEQALNGCFACAEEHKQLAEWLKELKALKEAPKGDLISREALKKALHSNCDLCHDKNTNWCEHCCPINDFEDLIDVAQGKNAGHFATMKQAAIYGACIPLNPRTKKNSQRIVTNSRTKAPMILPDAKYREYEKEAGWFLKKPEKPISQPVNVKCTFYRDSRRRCDLTNLLEAIDDILVKYGILADDNFEIIRGHDGSRVYIDREKPRTEIEITTLAE